MTKFNNNEKCNHDSCSNGGCKKADNTSAHTYSFYSNVLNKPFTSVEELEKAENAYFAEQKAKEDKASKKKEDAKKVEDAFKALNTARKEYKEKLNQLTTEYSEALTNLKNAFDLGKKDITSKLSAAEDTYAKALKEFTDKYKEGYHLTLKDSDFETTISGSCKTNNTANTDHIFNLFDLMFNF